MKTLSYLTTVIAFGTLAAFGQTVAQERSTAQVTIRVELKAIRAEREKRDKDEKKDKNKPKPETVTKSLEVEISAAKSINGPLKLVTKWYARDLTRKEQIVAKKEESEVPLDAAKTAKVSVPPCEFVSTPSHSQKGADGKMEKVDASGQTYSGWVIRAYEGTTLVGETSSAQPLLKLQD